MEEFCVDFKDVLLDLLCILGNREISVYHSEGRLVVEDGSVEFGVFHTDDLQSYLRPQEHTYGVRTVNLAFPNSTIASGLATGSTSCEWIERTVREKPPYILRKRNRPLRKEGRQNTSFQRVLQQKKNREKKEMYFSIAEPFHEIQISLDIVKKKSTILLDKPNKNDKLDILLAL